MKRGAVDQIIKQIYAARPDIVNDDAKLVAAVWYKCGYDPKRELYENLRRLPLPETITRRRRLLHERGEIKYSPEAEQRRFKNFVEARDEYGHGAA